MARKDILDKESIRMKLERMALEIIENNIEEENVILVGIEENGSVIARNMDKLLRSFSSLKVQLVNLTLNKKQPGEITLSRQVDITNQVIILVDDVANSGKTILYSLKPFLEFHPKKIQTLALVERTHKIFPVNLDYKGLSVATTLQEHIFVEVEDENITGAYLT
ncbi:MAG TPA: phosphoribosyltransferase family protein [Flavitalea sp.]|nr:phosphoribosyltransferase family protein [Flavitalea sp.]